MKWSTVLSLLFLCSLSFLTSSRTSAYEFEPNKDEDLYHVITHNTTGDIYIGAYNRLYRLSDDFTIIASNTTCSSVDVDCDNVNKVLAIDYDHNRLITCGGGNNGRCETRSLVDLSLDLKSDEIDGIVSGLSAVGLIAPALIGLNRQNVLYISSGHTSLNPLDYYLYINSRRSLETTLIFQIIEAADNQGYIKPSDKYKADNRNLQFKSAFVNADFTYFAAFRQDDISSENDLKFHSRLSRVCQNSSFDTLSEIYIRCVVNNIDYNLVQTMSVGPAGPELATSLQAGDDILYGVFAKGDGSGHPTGQSALCVYKWDDIEDAFFKALKGCITDSGSDLVLNYADGAQCDHIAGFTEADVLSLMCPPDDGRNLYRRYSQGAYTEAAVSDSVLTVNDKTMTSVIATVEENHTIAFIGTDDGQLMKVEIIDKTSARVYENITVDEGQEVWADTYLDKTSNNLIVLTKKKLIKLPVANCSQFITCDECIQPIEQDGDPYCGWCTLEKICTRFRECKESPWLSSNSAQCIEITNIEPPFTPYTDGNIQVTLTVQQLPPLNINESYDCKFGDFVSPGIKDGETITCASPPTAQVPQIPPGQASVDVPLSVHSSQTDVDFVTGQFTFFDCSAITSCSECVTSFTCDWCIYGNKCTHNASVFCKADDKIILNDDGNTTPNPGDMQGQGSCPQIVRQAKEDLIHENVQKEVRIPVKNLPNVTNVLYECVLTIEGMTSTIPATVEESTTIVCSQYTFDYTAEEQEIYGDIQVIWNDNLIDNSFQVTLYKCHVQRPDCSRCLSTNTTRPALDCVWCGDQCLYNSTCSSRVNNCPSPSITQIHPVSVATVTNQPEPNYTEVIELSGTDFGQMMSDIDSVMVDNKECEIITDGFDVSLQSVRCEAPVFTSASQREVIISVQGKTSAPASIVYQNPVVTEISPKFGILAGGTQLTISGSMLNTGDDLMVSVGGIECSVTNISETQITCTTLSYTAEAEVPVTVTFGQASRDGSSFTYTANPTVTDFEPKSSIQAGGRKINVEGMNFQYVQEAKMMLNGIAADNNCVVLSNEMMDCESPPADLSTSGQRSRRQADNGSPLTFSFDSFDLSAEFEFAVYPDPIYYPFSNETKYGALVKDGIYTLDKDNTNLIQLMGSGINLASHVGDVEVFIGGKKCTVKSLTSTEVIAEVPEEEPVLVDDGDHPVVVLQHGNIEVIFGPIDYFSDKDLVLLIVILVVVAVAIIVAIIIIVYYTRRIKQFDKQTERVYVEMESIQNQVQEEAQNAIADLTINMTDVTGDDLQGIVMPFVSHKQYVCNMMFSGFEIVPDNQTDGETTMKALHNFSELLLVKDFLITFIKMVDSNSKVTVREKGNFASLLVVEMLIEEKMDYFTEVLEALLIDHIDECVKSHKAKQVLIRTDSVTAKLLSNWIALSMYNCLKNYAGHPLYILYQAIKLRIEMGAVDALTQQSTYSLNLDHSLQKDETAHSVTLEVIQNADSGEHQKVKVLSCDTITQVKEKILDTLYRNEPYSARPKAHHLDLNWRHGRGGHLILSDIDATSQRSGQWIKLNTLGDLIPLEVAKKGCTVALIKKQAVANAGIAEEVVSPATLDGSAAEFVFDNVAIEPDDPVFPSTSLATEESGMIQYHLVKDMEQISKENSKKKNALTSQSKREIKGIKFPRAMATKEAIKKYVDGMFDTIFWSSSSQPAIPLPIKYLFDLFDREAQKHDVDQLILTTWKNNSLPARFWVQVITHPEYIFDIKKLTKPINGTLDIISRTFLDSCSPKKIQLTKESPINRLLYTKEIPHYRNLVDQFYEMVQTSEFDQASFVQQLYDSCHNFKDIFSRSSTLQHIFSYAVEHKEKLTTQLQQDDTFETQRNISQLKSIYKEFNAESSTR